ncbi:hypothetical protein [Streptomyces sp. UNOB3_S3]|uniref:hypothetical protein n=1 Tax=Streptomyces sp. UNOB3_S3 TaxID=2871682 RepID=UPI001E6589ED|nr:hypothetical protein [Streptomyces sp. UNOB3_S3]
MSWFLDALASGFQHPTDPARLQAFRIIFGVVCTARFTLAFGQGGWNRFTAGSLTLYISEHRFGPGRARLLARAYRPGTRLALVLVLAGATMELLYYLKSPNSIRYALLTAPASCSPVTSATACASSTA